MHELCYVCPPRQKDIIRYYGESDFSCILPSGHWGCHIFKLPNGKYIRWEDDFECDCCEVDEDDRCYFFGPITKKEFLKIEREYR